MPLDSRNADNSAVCKTSLNLTLHQKIMPVIAIFVFEIQSSRGACDSEDFIGIEI